MKAQLNPHISVDCVVFGFDSRSLKVLLVERILPDAGNGHPVTDLKLPGSLVYDNESLDHAAYRVLKELTGIDQLYLEQVAVFDSPQRTRRPADRNWLHEETGVDVGRIITVAYFSLVRADKANRFLSRLKHKAHWTDVRQIGKLAFDHNQIIQKGLEHLRTKIRTEPVALELLPRKFTLRQLQDLYEILLGTEIDNRNFRKKLHRNGYFVPLDEKEKQVAHKPARLYSFDKNKYKKIKQESVVFSI